MSGACSLAPRLACAWAALVWGAAVGVAASEGDSVTYSHHVWQGADGLPEDLAQAVAQTPDGHLWIGTSGGLVRFDGFDFTLFNHENQPAFVDESVYTLLRGRDGTLWAGTEGGGLLRFQHGRFRRFGGGEGLTNGFVRVVFEDHASRVWVGTDAGLYRLEGQALVRIDARRGLPTISVHSICEDRRGRLLVGGFGLLVLDGERASHYTSAESLADNSIRTIRETRDGAVWIGTIAGLRRLPGGVQGDPFRTPKTIRDANISALLEGRGGELWIGTYGRGLIRQRGQRVQRFSAPSSLPHNNVLTLFEDAEANVWVGTQGGLLRLSPGAASTITTADGAPLSINTVYQDRDGTLLVAALNGRLFRVAGRTLEPWTPPQVPSELHVRNVFRERSGALWFGTDGQGALRLEGRRAVRYTVAQGLGNEFVRAFCEDRDGSVWIGTDGGLSRWRAGRFESFTAEHQAETSVRVLLLDHAGRLWVASEGGLSRFAEGRFVIDRELAPLRGQKVWALHEDAEGGLWIGTQAAGLFVLKGGRLVQLTTQQGLPSNKIHFITEDRHGNLWMSGPRGIVSIARRDLEDRGRDPDRQLAVRLFTTADGLRTNQMAGGVQPAGLLDAAGDLWLPSTNGLVHVAVEAPDDGAPPPVVIERVLADDRDVALGGERLRLGPGDGKLEVHYTAVRLRSPERIRFRYWMEGFDRTWTAAGDRRVAFYTNLPPGPYRFHVSAYEINAPEAATERVLDLEWRPHFYQTGWFLALCAGLASAAAWGAYRLHVRNIRRRFLAVLEERGRLAREMHDTLVQGCLGVSTLLEAASRAQEVSPRMSTELLDRARNEVRATVAEARTAIWDLRHAVEGGPQWVQAVAELAERTSRESGLVVRCECAGAAPGLGAEVERGLMMVLREALLNSVRHGAPQGVWIRLRFEPRRLEAEIEDDGRGFDPTTNRAPDGQHYGLLGMRERVAGLGGTLEIESAPGRGTKVRVSVPLGPPAARPRS